MIRVPTLDRRKKYLQVALNSTLSEAAEIIRTLPQSDRILLEAGTPLIKHYGIDAIRFLKNSRPEAYVVADLKTMDRGETEVELAHIAGASGAIALGQAPIVIIELRLMVSQLFQKDLLKHEKDTLKENMP